jgi:DNA-binding SARP family transcriptional activator
VVAVDVRLLGGFDLRCGGKSQALAPSTERLIAFLAVNQQSLSRVYVAGTLWPDVTERRSLGNLRSALWRLQRPELVRVAQDRLSLAPTVAVDVHRLEAAAHGVSDAQLDLGGRDPVALLRCLLSGDLLPDWYDEWVVAERERLRGLRLHALELLAIKFLAGRQFALAHEAALAVVQAEPFRESGQRVLMGVHLAEGNRAEARRQYEGYRRLLLDELGAAPSLNIEKLVQAGEMLATPG